MCPYSCRGSPSEKKEVLYFVKNTWEKSESSDQLSESESDSGHDILGQGQGEG